jgi:hypothetical protein
MRQLRLKAAAERVPSLADLIADRRAAGESGTAAEMVSVTTNRA